MDPLAAKARLSRMLARHLALRDVYLKNEDYQDIAAQIAQCLPLMGKVYCSCGAPIPPQPNGRYAPGKYLICPGCNRGLFVTDEYQVVHMSEGEGPPAGEYPRRGEGAGKGEQRMLTKQGVIDQ